MTWNPTWWNIVMRKKNPNFNDCTESIVTYTTVPQKKKQKTILLSPICMGSEWPGNHISYNYPQHEFHKTHLHVLKQLEINIGFHPSNILLPSLICSSLSLSLWISFLKCFPKTYRNFHVPHQCSLSSSVVRTRQKEGVKKAETLQKPWQWQQFYKVL